MADYKFDYSYSLKEYMQICGEIKREFYGAWVGLIAILFFCIAALAPAYVAWKIMQFIPAINPSYYILIMIVMFFLSLFICGKTLTPWINSKLSKFNKRPETGLYAGQIIFDKTGLIICDEHIETRIKWAGIKDIFDLPSSVGLYISPQTIFVQNKHFFDFDQKDRFIEYCRAQITENEL